MAAFGSKLRTAQGGRLLFWCPGCDQAHQIAHGSGDGPRWGWNGSGDAPTFTPSVLVTGVQDLTDAEHAAYMAGAQLLEPRPMCCHSFVRDGQIQFLADCTHALAGKTVALPDWPHPGWVD